MGRTNKQPFNGLFIGPHTYLAIEGALGGRVEYVTYDGPVTLHGLRLTNREGRQWDLFPCGAGLELVDAVVGLLTKGGF